MASPACARREGLRQLNRVKFVAGALSALPGLSAARPMVDLPAPPPWTAREVSIDSGWVAPTSQNPETPEVVFSRDLYFEQASWTRLTFDGWVLPGRIGSGREARVFISTPQGDVQVLNAEHLRQWNGTSCYFNGGRVRVDLVMYSGSEPARVRIPSVMLGDSVRLEPPDRTVCGLTDDRVLSSDPRVGRIMPTACTGWLFNDTNKMVLTAGHCNTSASSVLQFNVPMSTSAGTPVFPPPEHQYAVDPLSLQWAQTGLGDDWAYFGVYPNPNTGLTPGQAQGQYFSLANAASPTAGSQARVTGFGSVVAPIPLTWNYVQKTAAGAYTALNGNAIWYAMDTTGGNSGSPVILDSTGTAFGVHTAGGCNTSGGANGGTAIQTPKLQTALAAPKGVCATGASGVPSGPMYAIGDAANNLGTIKRATGQFSRVSAPTSTPGGLAYRGITDRFYAVDASQRFIVIDPATGTGTPGPFITGAPFRVTGITHDPRIDRIIGVCNANGQFVSINPLTGVSTNIGVAGGGNVVGVALLTATGQTFALDCAPAGQGGPVLVSLNRSTGGRVTIGPLGAGLTTLQCLAWDDDQQKLFSIDPLGSRLVKIDGSTGAATIVGPTSAVWLAGSGGIAYRRIERVCFGDVNMDRFVNVSDLSLLLGQFGTIVVPGTRGDFNCDGQVGTGDLTAMIGALGCTPIEQP